MKKISFFVAVLAVSSTIFAHQVADEFQSKDWNWNNGSHMLSKAMDGEGMNNMPAKTHTHKHDKVKKVIEKPVSKKPKIKTHKMEEVDKIPMYDTGMRPSSSK